MLCTYYSVVQYNRFVALHDAVNGATHAKVVYVN